MLVGEQPGDQEDLAGRVFVGPAGQLLNRALAQAGLNRKSLYVTNAVRHFKFELRGKRRIHKTPAQREVDACNHFLTEEIELLKPVLIVALGATAAKALLKRSVKISEERGRVLGFGRAKLLITAHPSAILRLAEKEADIAFTQFVTDLGLVQSYQSPAKSAPA